MDINSPSYTVKRFSNVLVVPFTDLLAWRETPCKYRGGPIWPNWHVQKSIRFNGGFYEPTDAKPIFEAPKKRITGEHHFYIGPLYEHFGHQIRDFSSRIMPSITVDPQAVLVFASHKRNPWQDLSQVPDFFNQILKWFGRTESNVLIVSEPTIFDHLCVIPEPEPPLENPDARIAKTIYISDLTKHAATRNVIQDDRMAAYVSRTQFFSQILGEYEIERWFAALGYTIFHPQDHSLETQLDLYLSCRTVVFAEGSALHALQLLGRNLKRIFVLLRRRGDTTFTPMLKARSLEPEIIDVIRGTIRFNSHVDRDVAVLDFERLKKALIRVDPKICKHTNRVLFYRSQRRQLIHTLLSTRPRTLRSTIALVRSLALVRPRGYLVTLGLSLLLLPVDQLWRIINQKRKLSSVTFR